MVGLEDWAGRWTGRSGAPSGSVADAPYGFTAVGDDHADQQEDANDDVLHLGLDVHLREGLLQTADDCHGEHDADDGAAPAEDGHPAEQDDRDNVQLQAGAGVVTDRGVLQGEQDAGEGTDDPGDDVQPELDVFDPDAGELRGLGLQSDSDQSAPERSQVQDDAG